MTYNTIIVDHSPQTMSNTKQRLFLKFSLDRLLQARVGLKIDSYINQKQTPSSSKICKQ